MGKVKTKHVGFSRLQEKIADLQAKVADLKKDAIALKRDSFKLMHLAHKPGLGGGKGGEE